MSFLCHKAGSIAFLSDNGTEFKIAVVTYVCEQLGIKGLYSKQLHPKGNLRIENMQIFLKRTLTKFLDSSNLEWDELLPFVFYCYNIFPCSNGTEQQFYVMFGCEPAEGQLTHLNNCSRYYGDNNGKIILVKHTKLWKHHAAYLKDILYRNDSSKLLKPRNNTKFEIGQVVMVENHAHHAFKPKHLMDYRVLKILNESTLLFITPNCTDHKTNINDVKPATTHELIENAWD